MTAVAHRAGPLPAARVRPETAPHDRPRPWGPRDLNHPYWSAPRDRWLTAPGQPPLGKPYPCRCTRDHCHPRFCPCSGRTDLANLPDTCCAHHNTPQVAARANAVARTTSTLTEEGTNHP